MYLGTLDFKLEDLVADNKPVDQLAPFEFENGRKKSKKVPAVTAEFQGLRVTQQSTFLDYVYGGCEMSLSVAIDFSLGNGDPTESTSLHTTKNDYAQNKYLQAIKSVVTIMQYYNSTKRIESYGFGAEVVQNHEPSSCFAMTGDIFNP